MPSGGIMDVSELAVRINPSNTAPGMGEIHVPLPINDNS